MSGIKVTEMPVLTNAAADDKIYIVDVSDTSESPDGTSKQIELGDLAVTDIESDTLTVTEPSEGVRKIELPYTECYLIANQTGTDAPVLTEQLNNTGITFTSAYSDPGKYIIEFSDYPEQDKVNVLFSSTNARYNVSSQYVEDTGLTLDVYDIVGEDYVDGFLTNASVKITIFP